MIVRLTLAAALTAAVPAAAEFSCSPGQWVEPTPQPVALGAVVAFAGGFMAWGTGQQMSSRDGHDWVTDRAAARTDRVSGDGSYGQWVPALPDPDAAGPEHELRLLLLRHREGVVRTNLGVVNCGPVAATVVAVLHRAADGSELGRTTYRLEPGRSVQDNGLLRRLAGTDVDGAYAVLSTTSVGARFLAYASVVDDRTNDTVLVTPAQ